jgi:signal transduction histidine kinase
MRRHTEASALPGPSPAASLEDYDAISRRAVRLGARIRSRAGMGASIALATVLGVAVWLVPSNLAAAPVPIRIASIVVGLIFVIAGLVGVVQRPRSPVGSLLVVAGSLYLFGRLQGADPPAAGLAANLANSAWQGIVYYVTYSFPVGRLRSPIDRVLVIGGFAFTTVNNLFVLVTSPERVAPGLDTANPWFLALPESISDAIQPVLLVVGYLLILGGAAWLIRRLIAATPAMRRVLLPVYVSALAVSLTAIGLRVTVGVVSPSTDVTQLVSIALLFAYGLLPIGFLIGLLRAHIARGGVADLVIELGALPTPQRLRSALAAALHDPTIEVITWSGERNAYVDTDGRIAEMPTADEHRSVTVLERSGEPTAVLVHDAAVHDDAGLVAAVGAAVRLTLDNEELEQQVRRQVEEVRASRARVAAAADGARQKIERDIHDGAQQRLLGVAIGLQSVRAGLGPDSTEAAQLDEVREQLAEALAELRELARGVHPAVLTQRGLDAALAALARRSTIPVELEVRGSVDKRLPAAVESAVYFIVSSAVHNAQSHSQASRVTITLTRGDDVTVVAILDDGVGGAEDGGGTGITGMRDRAETVGGALVVRSPKGGPTQVIATIPVGGRHASG